MKNKPLPARPIMTLQRGIDYIGVSACAIVHNGKGQILMMKRGTKARDEHGCWDILGGAIEFGESIEATLRRELREELGTKPLKTEFLTAYEAHRQHNGTPTHWIALLYAIEVNPQTVRLAEPEKFDEIGWFNAKNLPTPLHSQFPKALKIALESGILM